MIILSVSVLGRASPHSEANLKVGLPARSARASASECASPCVVKAKSWLVCNRIMRPCASMLCSGSVIGCIHACTLTIQVVETKR
ncbi:hypothetical protein CY34DRAFT_256004 [Suillus luteus UH-Slu-Lm8-n1]|uniref:Unplaced genomic scaffold CY34scaffold_163, whole genome shotgun sequence n=1 Tax=Suillus luteus UH-Slu-Lm8-n1 TaxID=930992 RepID=A0A0D0ARI8_9AGAM|nr:hypothetical protein CY34DRAFT_256004 [Suillus luteus UH-Slu-Lm8-n1]